MILTIKIMSKSPILIAAINFKPDIDLTMKILNYHFKYLPG